MAASSLHSATPASVTPSRVTGPIEEHDPKFIIAVDYGTTYTGVAWTVMNSAEEPTLEKVHVVSSWPGAKNESKVPSTLTYSNSNGVSNWGHGIGDNALVLRLTKLDLEVPNVEKALRTLEQTVSEARLLANLTGPGGRERDVPYHLTRTSEDIMTEYLRNVFRETLKDIRIKNDFILLPQVQIDLVITHPAQWDYQARNITFRAVTTAFRDTFTSVSYTLGPVRLATEPEACAQYLVREAQERGSQLDMGRGECFIVVDAGGGTVDLASYRIEEAYPRFRMTRITNVSGAQCGATHIDDFFLTKFLPSRLKREDRERLLSNGGADTGHTGRSHHILKEEERLILERFQIIKHRFAGRGLGGGHDPLDEQLALPDSAGIADSERYKIRNGQLGITCDDLIDSFRKCVEGTQGLVQKQINKIMDSTGGRRPQAIFLSGGLSRNEYYRRCISTLAERNYMTFQHAQQGSDSWTAVAKGAVLMGMGIDCEEPPVGIGCPTHIGVVVSAKYELHEHDEADSYRDTFSQATRAPDRIHWIFRKNDLITPEGVDKSVRIMRSFKPDRGNARTLTNKAGAVTIVTASSDRGDVDVPARLDLRKLMQLKDVSAQSYDIKYDLDKKHGLEGAENSLVESFAKSFAKNISGKEETYQQVQMSVDMSVRSSEAMVQLRLLTTNAAGVTVAEQKIGGMEILFDGSIAVQGTTP